LLNKYFLTAEAAEDTESEEERREREMNYSDTNGFELIHTSNFSILKLIVESILFNRRGHRGRRVRVKRDE